ncbi:hypothetical protein Hypma_016172 [Hypsizygus marmoreus]|uniref:F-box domain-containing protein n=1 Tax=Hypsizygus marmoreus TaxID=39966 RepID=A0A369J5M2_HYPMA|nr:hypothetical protein Hypma_016172 [Hypsizygus marmoreus]
MLTTNLRVDVPQEIIDSVLDELQDDRAVLSTCALASRSFRARAQEHLYTGITLDLSAQARLSDLHTILITNPVLSDHVHDLSMLLRQGTFRTLQILSPILGMLSGVQNLTISGDMSHPPMWDFIEPELRSCMYTVMQRPNVTKVTAENVHRVPIWYLIRHCGQLRYIDAGKGVSLAPDSDGDSLGAIFPGWSLSAPPSALTSVTFPSSQLRTLRLDGIQCAIAFLRATDPTSCRTRIPHLQTLVLIGVDPYACQPFLDTYAQTLTTVDLAPAGPFFMQNMPPPPPPGFLVWTQMTALRSIHLAFVDWEPQTLDIWLHGTLASIPSVNRLETLRLTGAAILSVDMWRALDTMLAGMDGLSRAHIRVDLKRDCTSREIAERFLRDNLPCLRERGDVSVNWVDTSGEHCSEKH